MPLSLMRDPVCNRDLASIQSFTVCAVAAVRFEIGCQSASCLWRWLSHDSHDSFAPSARIWGGWVTLITYTFHQQQQTAYLCVRDRPPPTIAVALCYKAISRSPACLQCLAMTGKNTVSTAVNVVPGRPGMNIYIPGNLGMKKGTGNEFPGSAPFRPIPFRPNLFRPIPSPNPNP